MRWFVASLSLLPDLGCTSTVPTCADRLAAAADHAREQWPNAGAASEAVVGEGCAWEWSHARASVDGIGTTMVLLSEEAGIDDLFDLDLDVYAGGRLDEPSLLFFDQREGPIETWPLIGVGYHFDYEPCLRPDAPCFAETDFFVHEAGYHHVLLGAGGMTLATDADLVPGTTARVDAAGCSDIDDADVLPHLNTVKHGRAWDLHVWFPSDGEEPVVGVYDPEERWKDAVTRVVIEGGAFFVPDDEACACPEDADSGDTAAERPSTCGGAAPPPEEGGGCATALGLAWLPVLALAGRRRRRPRTRRPRSVPPPAPPR